MIIVWRKGVKIKRITSCGVLTALYGGVHKKYKPPNSTADLTNGQALSANYIHALDAKMHNDWIDSLPVDEFGEIDHSISKYLIS